MAPETAKNSLLTNSRGGIEDELIVIHLIDRLRLVVNGDNEKKDLDILKRHKNLCENGKEILMQPVEQTIISLQGPLAESVMDELVTHCKSSQVLDITKMWYMSAFTSDWKLFPAGRRKFTILRTGETGEDGFHIFVDNRNAESLADMLISHPAVLPSGTAAANALRIEAGHCLYGQDLDPSITPGNAGLSWMLSKTKLSDETSQVPGRRIMLSQLNNPSEILKKRVGLRGLSKGVAPLGNERIFVSEDSKNVVGKITSGAMSPSLDSSIAMAYLDKSALKSKEVWVEDAHGKRRPMKVTRFPMVDIHIKLPPVSCRQ